MEPADLAEQRLRYLDLFDVVAPAFAAGRGAETAAGKRAASELRALFPRIAEGPLVPYYRALGGRFFAWLDRTAA